MKTITFNKKIIISLLIIISLFIGTTNAYLYYKDIDCSLKLDSLNTKICEYLNKNNKKIPRAYLENPDEKNKVQFNYILNPNQIPKKYEPKNIQIEDLKPTVIYK